VNPTFTTRSTPALGPDLLRLLPEQGSFEIQKDQPGYTTDWHYHSLDEELFILDGQALLFWSDPQGEYQERCCVPGTWITLPAGTRHGSVAGQDGAVYLVRPQDGCFAETTFLEPNQYPHPDSARGLR
jgi:quercetin dioxygenase-like cupin family protein